MKRYEKMSKVEIIKMFLNAENTCDGCLTTTDFCHDTEGTCFDVLAKWLKAEIETKPRFKTLDTKEKFIKAEEEFQNYCRSVDCDECRYDNPDGHCIAEFLWEEVEV